MAKCPFSHLCKLYQKDAFVCNQDDPVELLFCGAYHRFLRKQLEVKMDDLLVYSEDGRATKE